ncbi:DUF4333 domain-containing protein [Saccharothrix isguenensis]
MSRIAHFAVTVSAVVVAVCVLVLTVRAMTSGLPLTVHQQMTFDSEELGKRVHGALAESGGLGGSSDSMSCPENVAIKEGTVFGCSVRHNGRFKTVRVVVVDAESGAIEVGSPSE